MSLKDLLRGTGVAIVTPFNQDKTVDYDALKHLINFIIEDGVQYIVTLGTTGETPTLTTEEKVEVIKFTYSAVEARVPVVVGVGGNDTTSLLHDLENLPLDQAIAILSASPYYNKPTQEGLFQHYKTLAAATTKPIILYNVPARTGSNMTAETTLRLAREVENIAGIKEASGNMMQCMRILKDKPQEFMVVSGDDALALPQIACGMDGVISVAANCFPKDFSTMVNYALAGDFGRAKAYNDKLMKGYELLFAENNPAGVKAFLSEMGIIKNELRLPLVRLSHAVHQQIRDYLSESLVDEPA